MMLDEAGWFAICFITFVVLFYRPIKKAILGFLDSRIKEISDELYVAKTARLNAEKEMQNLREVLSLADHQRKDMIKKAKQELETIFDNRCAEFQRSIEYRQKAAESSVSQMKIDSMKAVEREFLDMVIENVVAQVRAKSSTKLDLQILQHASKQKAA